MLPETPSRPPKNPKLGDVHAEKHGTITIFWRFSRRGQWEKNGVKEYYRPLDGGRGSEGGGVDSALVIGAEGKGRDLRQPTKRMTQ